METSAAEVNHLYDIIHTYTLFFVVFDVVFFVAAVIVVLLLIRFLKSRQKLIVSGGYLRYTIRGQEEERARIARELHDTIAQDLRYCVGLAEKVQDEELKKELSALISKSVKDVRAMSYNLAPPDVTKKNLVVSIMNLCQNFQEQSGIEFRMVTPSAVKTHFLTEEECLNIYRIVQESLNNISKHADAQEVTVLVRNHIGTEENGLYIFITDDGVGFDTSRNYTSGIRHFGLVGMKQRAELIGAKLDVSSEYGEGTQVKLIKLVTPPTIKEGIIKFK